MDIANIDAAIRSLMRARYLLHFPTSTTKREAIHHVALAAEYARSATVDILVYDGCPKIESKCTFETNYRHGTR